MIRSPRAKLQLPSPSAASSGAAAVATARADPSAAMPVSDAPQLPISPDSPVEQRGVERLSSNRIKRAALSPAVSSRYPLWLSNN
ncbi:unnamed protein product [Lampetra fluviatilis]